MNPLATHTSQDSRTAGLGRDWWIRAQTRHERACWDAFPARPAWVDVAERAVATAAAPDALPAEALPSLDTWHEAFALPLRPFLTGARDVLIAAGRGCLSPAHADLDSIADTFTAVLGQQLARIAAQTLVHELQAARTQGRLAGHNGRERFADFIWQQCEPAGLTALLERYPVLARLLGTASLQATQAGAELLTRFGSDRGAVITKLLGGFDPGPVVSIDPTRGDRHRHGRAVAVVSFADGRKVVYKPRSLAAHVLFGDVVAWLNERVPRAGLRTAHVVVLPGYGWVEFIAPSPLTWPSEADVFYRRHGVLLAALHALRATDMHCENVIACGDQPVFIDVETLLHPTLPASAGPAQQGAGADPAAEALAASVHRTGLLPYLAMSENGPSDQSGLGGGADGRCPDGVLDWDPPASDRTRLIRRRATADVAPHNRPRLAGETVDPADHEQALLDGFRLGYNAIAADRPGFTRLIESRGDTESGDIEIRVIVRSSRGYTRLLDESTHPDLLRDARDRDAALDLLRQVSAQHPVRRALAKHELMDLWAGDVPLVTTWPRARGLSTSAGQHVPGLLDRPALDSALDAIAAMGDVDRNDQEWLISASLATRRETGGHRGAVPAQPPVTAAAGDPDRLLAAACGLADRIVARGISDTAWPGPAARGSRVNWLGLQFVDDAQWMLLPMGAGLADGYLGVALFLAELASLTGIRRYTDVARRAVSAVPHLLSVLAGRPDLLATVGCGAAAGLGGISYGLARMATLLDDDEIRDWTKIAVELTATAADLPGPAGWAEGRAGCLAAMTAVQAELGLDTAGTLARTCADRLAALAESTGGECTDRGGTDRGGTDRESTDRESTADGDSSLSGFAHGPAGIGWALARFAAAAAEPRYRLAGQRAVRYDTRHYGAEPAAGARWAGYARLAGKTGPGLDRECAAIGADRSPGWCRGTAGLLAARGVLDRGVLDDAGLQQAVRRLAGRPVLGDLSLCHGELGIVEALAVLAAAGGPDLAARDWRRRTGLVLGVMRQQSRFCGTPGAVPTPGLFDGLAGIGYGLLRLGFTERVPSVLFLESTPGLSG
ncbi:MAG TPA: type 2 lanthipeptide synthetase LanM family protein [Streptosporangiaceae bacterium]|nr:type 2 lanthipeptide synthetase LanM family protein [Streptosporangiaceae bacterium]